MRFLATKIADLTKEIASIRKSCRLSIQGVNVSLLLRLWAWALNRELTRELTPQNEDWGVNWLFLDPICIICIHQLLTVVCDLFCKVFIAVPYEDSVSHVPLNRISFSSLKLQECC